MARTDFEPLTWEEAEQNRREVLDEHFAQIPQAHSLLTNALPQDLRHHSPRSIEPPAATLNETAAEKRERLRSEIKRGREYLEQAETDLAESRAQLEAWPVYDRVCGTNPLAQLTRSVVVSQGIARFLAGWLHRRESELNTLTNPARPATGMGAPKLRAAAPRKPLLHRGTKPRLAA